MITVKTFKLAMTLFNGNVAAVKRWLHQSNPDLVGKAPIDYADLYGQHALQKYINQLIKQRAKPCND